MLKKLIKNKNMILIALIVPFYIYLKSGNTFLPIEELALPSAVGVGLDENSDGDIKYTSSLLLDNFTPTGEVATQIVNASAYSYSEVREQRQRELNRRHIVGLERIFLMTENLARYGITPIVDLTFKNPNINDALYTAICKDDPEDIYKIKIPGYPSVGDYIEGMVDHSNEFNFSPQNYKLMDIYLRLASEGRSVALPYLEIKDQALKITGTALFKDSIMVQKLDTEESKIMNFLRDSNLRGLVTIQDNPRKSLTYYAKSKKSVKCQRKNGEYTFTINLSLKGDVISNTLTSDKMHEEKDKKEVEKRLREHIEKQCYDFIKKMQDKYKVDCLELGRIAAAKYGRKSGVDWDEIVSASKINVNVKVNITNHGRGEF